MSRRARAYARTRLGVILPWPTRLSLAQTSVTDDELSQQGMKVSGGHKEVTSV
jgi:hypothetical protein